ncbi:hypothetical protein CEXT_388471 [Caerostris extrusa]|uniref:Secreted protein n=1 Tax=Caerostris extrusa TaxID=172846 RepID=A0AAV4W8F3_CAEEX|nr:hypothetical protein CEXT_388471 [Caerostris extrusa]
MRLLLCSISVFCLLVVISAKKKQMVCLCDAISCLSLLLAVIFTPSSPDVNPPLELGFCVHVENQHPCQSFEITEWDDTGTVLACFFLGKNIADENV